MKLTHERGLTYSKLMNHKLCCITYAAKLMLMTINITILISFFIHSLLKHFYISKIKINEIFQKIKLRSSGICTRRNSDMFFRAILVSRRIKTFQIRQSEHHNHKYSKYNNDNFHKLVTVFKWCIKYGPYDKGIKKSEISRILYPVHFKTVLSFAFLFLHFRRIVRYYH